MLVLTLVTELPAPAWLALAHPRGAVPVAPAVGHLALLLAHAALRPLPAALAVARPAPVPAVAAADHRAHGGGAVLACV